MAAPSDVMDQNAEDINEDDGLTVVLTPIQLASILDHAHISPHEMMVNRLWAVGNILFSAAQLAGAAGLLATPDPTLLTKVGSGVLAAHGFDQGQAAVRQLWTGESIEDFTQEAGEAASREIGVNPEYAHWAGVGLDVVVPIGVGTLLSAVRIMSIRAGRIFFEGEESAGGHAVARHIGRPESFLRERLADPKFKGPAASTFSNFDVAGRVSSEALQSYAVEIRAWSQTSNAGPKFVRSYDARRVIGRGILRSTNSYTNMSKVRLVLIRTQQAGKPYFLLTIFPES